MCVCASVRLYADHAYILFNQQNSIQNKLNCVLFFRCYVYIYWMWMTQYTTVNIVTLAHSEYCVFVSHTRIQCGQTKPIHRTTTRWFQFFVFYVFDEHVNSSLCRYSVALFVARRFLVWNVLFWFENVKSLCILLLLLLFVLYFFLFFFVVVCRCLFRADDLL